MREPDDLTPVEKLTIHVLMAGRPVCEYALGDRITEWPTGLAVANCPACLRRCAQLAGGGPVGRLT